MSKIFSISLISSLLFCGTCYEAKDYILKSSKCKIPNIEPFYKEVEDIMMPQFYLPCNNSELLTFVEKTENNSAILHIRENLKPLYSSKNINCCYSYVTRNGSLEEPDVGIAISPCYYFETKVLLTHDIVKVVCNEYWKNETRTVYDNVHNIITVKNEVKAKMKSHDNILRPFSVLFIVVDSLSRLNFMRTMNQTYQFLKENNFIEMKGYTKVADNTYPNFASLITGLSWSKIQEECKAKQVGGLDKCPMIWYDYRDKGYITAYAEDDAPISTFNFEKKGFKNPPTDYYFKPYIEASETLYVQYRNSMPYCTGPETAGERILNLAKDFTTTFKNHPTFGIFWMNTFSHNDINAPYGMDEKMKEFFIDMKNEQILNESIVFFLSDHGVRFGNIRKTTSGWFEERTPINMVSVPKKFQDNFRKEYDNLRENSNKLTSAFDIFMTLQHILTLSGLNSTSERSSACPKCTSLFKKIPSSRSCKDAGIPPEWCTCMGHFQTISNTSAYVRNATELAVEIVNRHASLYKQFHIWCSDIILEKILLATISESLSHDRRTRYLFIVFKSWPSATFLVTVKFRGHVTRSSTFFVRRISNEDPCIRRKL